MNLFEVYSILDIEPVCGKGCYIYDSSGAEYLDLYGGHAVISIGHCHPLYVERMQEQLNRIGFYSNSVIIPQQQQLAQRLGRMSGYDDYRLFLCNSGAEANENAIKLASFHNGRKKILTFRSSFHGRTHGALAVTDSPKLCAPVNGREHVRFLPLNDSEAVQNALCDDEVCAVIIEGIQGLAGIRCPEASFLQALREMCDRCGAVLILDEIQSGYGRSGRFFAHQYAGIRPDIITVAKGMGNGFPVAGVLIHPKFEAHIGMLGTTFGGNHLACTAAIAVLDVIEKENLTDNALKTGNYLKKQLASFPQIREVRGQGLMIGLDLGQPVASLRNRLIKEHRIITGSSSDKNVMRLLPALCLQQKHADLFLQSLKTILSDL
ncbi:MAG: aminotransferase class III-fold pyridoxal phosphate-dependent enzyme [Bacteroidales bacterium]|jgi:acetylornithine aminotransferase|nr:aminotransferase class III-fold pyridoxal phosphate-dependent enzyme [Bacteroidales bacterium]